MPCPALSLLDQISEARAPEMVTKLDSEACEIGEALFFVLFIFLLQVKKGKISKRKPVLQCLSYCLGQFNPWPTWVPPGVEHLSFVVMTTSSESGAHTVPGTHCSSLANVAFVPESFSEHLLSQAP